MKTVSGRNEKLPPTLLASLAMSDHWTDKDGWAEQKHTHVVNKSLCDTENSQGNEDHKKQFSLSVFMQSGQEWKMG